MKIKAFITHKQAEKYSECQDFFAINLQNKAIALSDGMSQSIFPCWWAEILATHFVEQPTFRPTHDTIGDLRQQWLDKVQAHITELKSLGKNPWRLEGNIAEKKGAGATFCGLVYTKDNNWTAYILGDSCLIETDKDYHILNIHTTNKDGFGNHPDYFDSFRKGAGEPQEIQGGTEKGHYLLLVSDPIAEFLDLQRKNENEREYIRQLVELNDHAAFCELVEQWRKTEHLHNDDTTLIVIEDNETYDFNIVHQDQLSELIKEEQEKTASVKEQPAASVPTLLPWDSPIRPARPEAKVVSNERQELEKLKNKLNEISRLQDELKKELNDVAIVKIRGYKQVEKALRKIFNNKHLPQDNCVTRFLSKLDDILKS